MEPYRSTLDISVEEKSDSSFIVNEDEVKKEVWLAMAARIKLEAVELAECGNTKDAGDLIHEHLRYMQGIKLQSDSIEREAIKLGELISSFEGDDISSLKKSAHFSAYEMMRKRGSYEAEADARIFEAKIRVSQPEALAEFDQKIKAVLKKSGYDESSIAEASTVFNELANNAIEHGCRNNQYASIWVKCRIAPSHIKFTVKDPGAGFDYEEVMSKINAEKDSSEERGRGLMIVNAMSERLVFSQKGTRVEAVVMRKTMRVDTFIATGTEEECIFLGNIAVVRLQGDIDLHNAAKTKTLVESLLTSSYDRLIIDLSKVRYIDSSGIGALIAAQNKYKKAGGSLVLASISASVSKVLKIAHLSKFFDIFSNIDEAVKYLRE
jgi:anti-sigma B factor antagonist